MGNCAMKPKVLSEAGAPAPEVFDDSLLEEQKIEAVKSLRYLLLQDKPDKKTEDEEKITLEKMPVEISPSTESPVSETKSPVMEDKTDKKTEEDVKITPEKTLSTEDLKTSLPEEKSLTQSPVIETKLPVTEIKANLADDQKIMKEEAVREEKVIDDVSVKETETGEVGAK